MFDIVTVPGASLLVETIGEGPPVVVLHGGPGFGSGYLRRDLIDLLGPDHRLIFWDQRASGRSTGLAHPERVNMATFVADLEAVRRAARLETVRLLGHSFGGLVALHYALAHPERTAALVLLDPDPASHAQWIVHREVIASRTTKEEGLELLGKDPDDLEGFLRLVFRPYFAKPESAGSLRFGDDVPPLPKIRLVSRLMRESLGEWDLRPRLGEIRCPTLVVAGAAGVFPPEAPEELHAGIEGSRLVLLTDVGHFPHLEAPEVFQREVLTFFREGPTPDPDEVD